MRICEEEVCSASCLDVISGNVVFGRILVPVAPQIRKSDGKLQGLKKRGAKGSR